MFQNMCNFFRIYFTIQLILYLNMQELFCKAISNNFKDSNGSINHIKLVAVNKTNKNTILEQTNLETTKKIEYIPSLYEIGSYIWNKDEDLLHNLLHRVTKENEEKICLLDVVKETLRWWSNSNGTLRKNNLFIIKEQLDLSHKNISDDKELLSYFTSSTQTKEIVAFSLAYNNLKSPPIQTLQLISRSVKYLSLKGNKFINLKPSNSTCGSCTLKKEFLKILNKMYNYNPNTHYTCGNNACDLENATFPFMPVLEELDISNCSLTYIDEKAFETLPNLQSLYMASNKLFLIPSDIFNYAPSLQLLDLSFINADFESLEKFSQGVIVEGNMFRYLPKLIYLNLSHTKLNSVSAAAFTNPNYNLKYLSLCYTAFPVLSNTIFKNSSITVMDLTGNTNIVVDNAEKAFEGLSESLSYLIFENANLKNLSWIKPLHKLRLLALADNNIKTLSNTDFSGLKSLRILDLTSNQIGNWYSRVFENNENLRLISLNDNNINVITSEMLKDFSNLIYLSLGNNNFLCDCFLRDLVDIAAVNNKEAKCNDSLLEDHVNTRSGYLAQIPNWRHFKIFVNTSLSRMDIPTIVTLQNLQKLGHALKKITNILPRVYTKPKILFLLKSVATNNVSNICSLPNNLSKTKNISLITKLQLLDYGEENYWCYNETRKQHVIKLDCQRATVIADINRKLSNLLTCIIITLGSLFLIFLVGALIYVRRWHIYYFYSSLKSASLLSLISKKHLKKLSDINDQNQHILYDIFVSYCHSDRDWIVEEFMPNIENSDDISICLHERDFQVGVTILDNIVSCMERSKTLMLIVSSNFLLSHWCQFEMQLAQYQLFDLSKEHLILVLLEDIPRSKRPKILQFLMNVKTYIKWPGDKKKGEFNFEERKLFWKRLNRTLSDIGLASPEFQEA